MSNEVQTYKQSDFQPETNLPTSVNAGSVTIEMQRAIAEAQGQIAIAKRFPRNLTAAHTELMESCSQTGMAEIAFYSVPRAGGTVNGPSIRLAEEIARCYGNFEYGHRELSRDDKKSEVEVYAWDKEKNNFSRRQITVFHTRDTKNGSFALRDQKDIDDKIANVASKQVRSRILALLPKWLVQAAEDKCRETLMSGGQVTMRDRVLRMVAMFGKHSVTVKHLEKIIGHTLDDITPDEIADLQGIFNAIKEGAKISEFFPEDDDSAGEALTHQAIEQHLQTKERLPAPDMTAKPAPRKKQEKPADVKPEATAATATAAQPDPAAAAETATKESVKQATKDPAPETKAAGLRSKQKPEPEPESTPETTAFEGEQQEPDAGDFGDMHHQDDHAGDIDLAGETFTDTPQDGDFF